MPSTDDALEELLKINTAPSVNHPKSVKETESIKIKGDEVEVEVHGGDAKAIDFLITNGFDPNLYEVTGVRRSEWTMANGQMGESNRFTFKAIAPEPTRNIDDLLAVVDNYEPRSRRTRGLDGTFVVALGDLQIGKVDGDGVEGTIRRVIDCIEGAHERWQGFPVGNVHIAWLGDHVEGYTSQGGANVARTQLTLTEQTRIIRRLMMHAVQRFNNAASLTVVAVPGNHGEPQRFMGKGVVRYDDSHDTEALIAVAEACSLAGDKFDNTTFYTPKSDEMTVVNNLAGGVVAHAHGHQWRPGQHMKWWQGQAFGRRVSLEHADILLSGHLHHLLIEQDGPRTFMQVPALESESTWWRHSTGSVGDPGILTFVLQDNAPHDIEVVR